MELQDVVVSDSRAGSLESLTHPGKRLHPPVQPVRHPSRSPSLRYVTLLIIYLSRLNKTSKRDSSLFSVYLRWGNFSSPRVALWTKRGSNEIISMWNHRTIEKEEEKKWWKLALNLVDGFFRRHSPGRPGYDHHGHYYHEGPGFSDTVSNVVEIQRHTHHPHPSQYNHRHRMRGTRQQW